MTTALIVDANGIANLQRVATFSEEWFSDPSAPDSIALSKRTVDEFVYLLSAAAKSSSRVLVIDWRESGPLGGLKPDLRGEALSRILRCALSIFEQSIVIPSNWKQFHLGHLLSFQSNGRRTNETARIEMDCAPDGTKHVFAFALDTRTTGQVSNSRADYELFRRAIKQLPDALEKEPEGPAAAAAKLSPLIELTKLQADPYTHGLTVDEWYRSKLTREQIRFVDAPLSHSTRLRGPAGTGKTISLVIKCLKNIYQQAGGPNFRVAFLTHSMASVDQVETMIMSMDDRETLFGGIPNVSLTVSTLQSLANRAMAYDLHGLQPLSNDGLEGRQLQMELLSSVLQEFKRADWIAYEARCTESFKRYMQADLDSAAGKFFRWELMNEFACVLDADGVRDSWDRKARYLEEKRKTWMMQLNSRTEREVVLRLYEAFRKELRDMRAIGIDQMIADYLGFLDSFRWDSIRRTEGFDTLFVDELHLFNRQERMVFRHLMRDDAKQPSVFMAYDAKQSPRDTFVGMTEKDEAKFNFWRDAKLGNVDQIDLIDVFRYTAEIARALEAIDQSFPGLDLEEEWPKYSGVSKVGSGPVPSSTELQDTQEIYDFVFPRAGALARATKKGKKVAVLCLDAERFQTYLRAGQHKDLWYAITSREEVKSLAHAGKRFILSMPEYVAGLQFDTVFLVDADQSAVPEGPYAAGARRRFVSQVYLGASRAERVLEIYASRQYGGLSDVLRHAHALGAIRQIQREELVRP